MRFKVWGEWQEYDEATEHDVTSPDVAVRHVATTADNVFPDWNDGNTAKLYARAADAEDGDDEWCPEDDPDTLTFVARLRVTSEITIKRK